MSAALKPEIEQKSVNCPDCGTEMRLRPSRYNNHLFYACPRWLVCGGTHGAHPNGNPLGIPADIETKRWRQRAHAAFDALWNHVPEGRKRKAARRAAYRLLQQLMGMSEEQAHIGRFTTTQCQQLIEKLITQQWTRI